MFKPVVFFLTLFIFGCVSVPLPPKPIEPQGNQITFSMPTAGSFVFYVRGFVNNLPKTFVLDTGSIMTVLANDDQTKNFTVIKKGITGFATLGSDDCDLVKADKFYAASTQRLKLQLARCQNQTNRLGLDVFSGLTLSLNFSHALLATIPALPKIGIPLPMRRSQYHHIELPVQLGPTNTLGFFDTGANFNVIDRNFVDAHPELFTSAFTDESMVTDVTGKETKAHFFKMNAPLKIGELEFKDQLFASFPFNESLKKIMDNCLLVLGTNTIAAADWAFDLKNNLWLGNLRTR